MRGSTQREALATQREKNIPHVPLIKLLTFFNEQHLKIPVVTVFLALRPGHNPKIALWTHNYIYGWKAVFDEQILAPRFGGF